MSHEIFMLRCLELAKKGAGFVAPNPMVGAVIVHDGNVIGEGYHEIYGQAHAEVNAINSVKNKELLTEATIYVNLEPCAHFGKTPPCADLIVKSKIPKVIIACIDSFSEVAGKGVEKLKSAGCEVLMGTLETEALELNRRFFTYHEKKRPYIILKWAQSQHGYMDTERTLGQKGIHWITQVETKQLVHKWRHEEAGILVGANTIINDNPSLTVREIEGNSPTRFVIDPNQKINPTEYVIGQDGHPTHILSSVNLQENLNEIHSMNIQSILVEGGAFTLQQFIDSNLWDEARVLTGVNKLNSGLKAPIIDGTLIESYEYGLDSVNTYLNA